MSCDNISALMLDRESSLAMLGSPTLFEEQHDIRLNESLPHIYGFVRDGLLLSLREMHSGMAMAMAIDTVTRRPVAMIRTRLRADPWKLVDVESLLLDGDDNFVAASQLISRSLLDRRNFPVF